MKTKRRTKKMNREGFELLERFHSEVLYFGRKVTKKLIKIVQSFCGQKRLYALLAIKLAEADMAEHMIAHLIYISRHIFQETNKKKEIDSIADLMLYLEKRFDLDLDQIAREWV